MARTFVLLVPLWLALAFLLAAQSWLVAYWRDEPQAWWPSLGYACAVFSIWMMLAPLVTLAVRRLARLRVAWPWRGIVLAAGLPLTTGLHVGAFVFLWWPVYNNDGAIASRWEMAEPVLRANLDLNTLLYAAVVAVSLWRKRGSSSPAETQTPEESLVVRSRGGMRIVPFNEIDWIEAAGNYCEVHAGPATILVEMSMRAMEGRLPSRDFARVHRRWIVRLDRITQVSGTGHGDGRIRLADGAELRLSRRFRLVFEQRLEGRAPFVSSTVPLTG